LRKALILHVYTDTIQGSKQLIPLLFAPSSLMLIVTICPGGLSSVFEVAPARVKIPGIKKTPVDHPGVRVLVEHSPA